MKIEAKGRFTAADAFQDVFKRCLNDLVNVFSLDEACLFTDPRVLRGCHYMHCLQSQIPRVYN